MPSIDREDNQWRQWSGNEGLHTLNQNNQMVINTSTDRLVRRCQQIRVRKVVIPYRRVVFVCRGTLHIHCSAKNTYKYPFHFGGNDQYMIRLWTGSGMRSYRSSMR